MVDASLVLDMIVAVSIAAGAVFAVLELRAMGRDRRVQTVVNMYSNSLVSSEGMEVYFRIMDGGFQNAAEMEQKCGREWLSRIAGFFEGMGYLSRKKFVDPKVVMDYLPIMLYWRNMKPWILFDRERRDPLMWTEFEYLATMAADYDAEYLAGLRADYDALKIRKKSKAK